MTPKSSTFGPKSGSTSRASNHICASIFQRERCVFAAAVRRRPREPHVSRCVRRRRIRVAPAAARAGSRTLARHAARTRRALAALRAFPLAPRSFHLCTDRSVSDVDFVVEERKRGIAIRRDLPERFRDDPALARRIGEMLVDTLASLHTVDPRCRRSQRSRQTGRLRRTAVERMGRPLGSGEHAGYRAGRSRHRVAARQPSGIARRPESCTTTTSSTTCCSTATTPPSSPRCSTGTCARSAIRSSIWDTCSCSGPSATIRRPGARGACRPGATAFRRAPQPLRQRTGFDVQRHWYYVFNIFRFAAILQQIYARFERGQTHDERFREMGNQANAVIAVASMLTDEDSAP